MGLRIIDRKPKARAALSPDETKKALQSLTAEWVQKRKSALPSKSIDDFMTQYETAKKRSLSGDDALLMVQHMNARLKSGWSVGFQPHQKVDVATLLVLL